MDYKRKTYIEFVYPGAIVNETSTKEVKFRETVEGKIPEGAFGFRFFDVIEVIVKVDGMPVKLKSEQINKSPMHYYGGRIYTRTDVALEIPNNPKFQTLLANMNINNWKLVIKTRMGNFQLFEETDILIETKEKEVK